MSVTARSMPACLQCRRGHHDACPDRDECGCGVCAGDGVVAWEDPPGLGRRGTGRPAPVAAAQVVALRAQPGRWARVHDYDKPTSAAAAAGRINRGASAGLAAGEWEATGRRTETGSALFVRYVGGPR